MPTVSSELELQGNNCLIPESQAEYIQKCNDRNALNEMIAKIRVA